MHVERKKALNAGILVIAWFKAWRLLNLIGFVGTFGIGLAWVATSFGVNYLFEQKSLKLWLINAGYQALMLTLMGGIIGAWQ